VLAEGTPDEMKQRYGGAGGKEATMEDTFISLLETSRKQDAAA